METILVTGGVSAFAQRVTKLFPDDHRFVFADSLAIPSPLLQTGKYVHIPPPAQLSFVHTVLKICLDQGITQIIPLRKEELVPFAQSKLLFEEYGIVLLLPDLDTLQKLSMLTNPTSRNCPRAIARKNKENEPSSLVGIYSQNEEGKFLLCCLS